MAVAYAQSPIIDPASASSMRRRAGLTKTDLRDVHVSRRAARTTPRGRGVRIGLDSHLGSLHLQDGALTSVTISG